MVERAPASPLRHGRGADLRRADEGRRVVRPGSADRRLLAQAALDYDDDAARRAAPPARDRGEPLAGNPPRPRRQSDRLRGRRGDLDPGRARALIRVVGAGSGGARARLDLPAANGAQRTRTALVEGAWPRSTRPSSPRRVPPTPRCRPIAHERGDAAARGSCRPGPSPTTSEEELQRRLEEQLRKVRVQDLLLESVASILNLSARRIAKADERDLDQGRLGSTRCGRSSTCSSRPPRAGPRGALAGADAVCARGARGPRPGVEAAASEPQPEAPAPERPSGLWTPPGTYRAGHLVHCARLRPGISGRFSTDLDPLRRTP